MSSDDKPFACKELGCNMCFSNVDHLNVHRQKHKMSLSLGAGGLGKGFLFTGDQTPTPTKCLKNLDQEITLFGELSKNPFEVHMVHKNPFEEAFRKAAQEVGSISIINQEESLNTPTPLVHSSHEGAKLDYIPLPGPSEGGLCMQTGDTLNTPVPLPQVMDVPPIPRTVDDMEETQLNMADVQTPTSLRVVEDMVSKRGSPEPGEIHGLGASPIDLSLSRNDSSYTQVVPSITKVLLAAKPESMLTNQPSLALITSTTPSLTSSSASTMPLSGPAESKPAILEQPQCVAVLVKLPNGTTVPVQLPAQLAAPPQPAVTKTVVTQAATINSSTATKQKLKEALIGQNIRVMSEAVDRVTNPIATQSLLTGPALLLGRTLSRGPEVLTRAADTSTPNRKRKAEEDDPDERRKKFLERNRAAAARCRQKKKVWINGLEQKADDLQGTNSALLNEVTMLRSEVAQLKQLLLAHKDCPITLQQQNAGQVAFQEVQTLEVTPQGMKMVANTVLVTPQNDVSTESSITISTTTKK